MIKFFTDLPTRLDVAHNIPVAAVITVVMIIGLAILLLPHPQRLERR